MKVEKMSPVATAILRKSGELKRAAEKENKSITKIIADRKKNKPV